MTDTLDPALEAARVSVLEMKLSDGRVDYYVAIRVGDRVITPYKFAERWKADLEVAAFQHVLNNAPPVNYLDYGPEKSIAPESPAAPQAEIDRLREALREIIEDPYCSVLGEHLAKKALHPETPNGGQ